MYEARGMDVHDGFGNLIEDILAVAISEDVFGPAHLV